MREVDGMTIHREYEYNKNTIRFTIRKIRHDREGKLEDTESIEIRSLIRADLLPGLLSAGFDEIKTYRSISMIEF